MGSVRWVALAVSLAVGEAWAQSPLAENFPVERFRIAQDRSGVADVEWGAVPTPFSWSVGFWLGQARNPLITYRLDTGERTGTLIENRLGASLVAAVGLLSWAQVGLELPLVLYQDREAAQPEFMVVPVPRLSTTGVGDLRLAVKAQLLRASRHHLDLAIIPAFSLPTSGGQSYRGDSQATFSPELAASRALGQLRLAANLGMLVRPTTQTLAQLVQSELTARMGVGYRFGTGDSWEIDGTLSGATGVSEPFSRPFENALEGRAMVAYLTSSSLQIFGGAGAGFANGYGSPDYRLFAGIRLTNWRDRPPLDTDGDGQIDIEDGCPDHAETANGYQDEDGCPDQLPDRDGDGLPDATDGCPDQPETLNGFADDDGCPDDPDADRDGVMLPLDRCATDPEDKDSFQDDDGCPDPDNDADGSADALDGCPIEPGPVENKGCPDKDSDLDGVVDRLDLCGDVPGAVELEGCPLPALSAAATVTENKIEIVENIYFRLDADVIEPRSYEVLNSVASLIQKHPEITRLRVEGHTDNKGKADRNLDLSRRRARAVMKYLVARGVGPDRLDSDGYGSSQPLDSNDTKEGRARNRRVEFRILGSATGIQRQDTGPSADTIEK